MRVVVTGATGNVGTSVLRALAEEPAVHSVVGIARRVPQLGFPKTHFIAADVAEDDLDDVFTGADAVIHLAWRLQPARRAAELDHTNVRGSRRVAEASERAGVGALVVASSIGAYAEGPKDRLVDESWPVDAIKSSLYVREKVAVEQMLDEVEARAPQLRVVRFRPALIFKRHAASEIARLFLGPLVPSFVFAPRRVPVVPTHPRFVFQCVHSLDVGVAFVRAVVREVRGAFNLAALPPLDGERLAQLLDARTVPLTQEAMRRVVDWTWRLHLQPTNPGWIDLAFGTPLIDPGRAERELDWRPEHDTISTFLDLLDGLRRRDGMATPPLVPRGRRQASVTEGSVGDTGRPRSPLPLQ